jgi:hypothetical protein
MAELVEGGRLISDTTGAAATGAAGSFGQCETFERSVHAFDLAIDAWMVRFEEAATAVVFRESQFESKIRETR